MGTVNTDIFHRHTFANATFSTKFTNPFCYRPDDACKEAAHIVRSYIDKECRGWAKELSRGKMLGVLICKDVEGSTGFLAAYSGTIGGRLNHEWFVPAILDYERPDGVFKKEEAEISAINASISAMERSDGYAQAKAELEAARRQYGAQMEEAKATYAANKVRRQQAREANPGIGPTLDSQSQFEKAEMKRLKRKWEERICDLEKNLKAIEADIRHLKAERIRRSNILQRWLFRTMRLHSFSEEVSSIRDIFLKSRHREPPSGAGECCAPRLLDYAFKNNLTPISMAEFWVGDSPAGEIRVDGGFYPACQAKCAPLLNWMLRGIECEASQFGLTDGYGQEAFKNISNGVQTLFEDHWLLAVNKPSGLITVSENKDVDSLMKRVLTLHPNITGPGYVHRLDQPTSGIILIAKDKETHKQMQSLFENRKVDKRYVAILKGRPKEDRGIISLPLLPNPEDRPRQMVDFVRGKKAVTEYEVVGETARGTKVYFHPQTGRTHQLRVHAASPMGLGCPIVGDNLYGQLAERLYLHAERVELIHPWTGERIIIECDANF